MSTPFLGQELAKGVSGPSGEAIAGVVKAIDDIHKDLLAMGEGMGTLQSILSDSKLLVKSPAMSTCPLYIMTVMVSLCLQGDLM